MSLFANPAARQVVAVLGMALLATSPAAGFDSYWHEQCVQRVGEQFGFTTSAWKIMQLGNFSADFFGPVSEAAAKSASAGELAALEQANDPQVRGAAVFLHFDDLNSDFQSNSNFDYFFTRLLQSTQKLIAGFNRLAVDDRTRNALTLVTLGASLHAVQDFYSHSNWIHHDFDKTDVKTVALQAEGLRAPTWFEFREKHSDTDQWPFQVQSEIYPPPAGAPIRSQAEYHAAGPVPARGDDDSDFAHQQLAVNTAIAASIEWVARVETNSDAKKAIESAMRWDLKKGDP